MDLRGKKLRVIGETGLIGSHAVDELIKEDPAEIRIYNNFVRGTHENLMDAQHIRAERKFRIVSDYEGGLISKKMFRIVSSHVDFVKRVAWSR